MNKKEFFFENFELQKTCSKFCLSKKNDFKQT